ncbi:head maturation protease, ClpP-related [Xanthobacter autotrophicus]|uniref:head maturation protease, ClpP-related n=1 Tax=Xanthobacter autotrophicus TaxID=280 RepID=UPI0037293BB1
MARDLIVDGELVLYGPVGGGWWDDSGFTAADVLQALAQIEGDVTVRLNSGGGVAWDGIAIYNALKARPDPVTVIVDGVAASAASVIAMAGDEVTMRAGALMMIHNASTITWGDANDHAKNVDLLRKLDGQIAAIYAERTGMDLTEIRALMDSETWMDGADAIDKGFAGAADETLAAKASAFDYRLYAHAPKPLQSAARKLKAPAAAQPWGVPLNSAALKRRPAKTTETPPAAAAATAEPPMPEAQTDKDNPTLDAAKIGADAVAAYRGRRDAVLALPEAKGREGLAGHLTDTTALSVDEIKAALAAAPAPAVAPEPENPTPEQYAAARAAGLAGPGGKPKDQAKAENKVAGILANHRSLTGFPART